MVKRQKPTKTSLEGLVKIFKALANDNRLRLFLEILEAGQSDYPEEHDCFLHTIMERLEIGAPTVSHHIKELVNAGLITTERRGKFVTCKVNQAALRKLNAFIEGA